MAQKKGVVDFNKKKGKKINKRKPQKITLMQKYTNTNI